MGKPRKTAAQMAEINRQIIVDHLSGKTHTQIAAELDISERHIKNVVANEKRKVAADRIAGTSNPIEDLLRDLVEMRRSQARILSDRELVEDLLSSGKSEALRGLSNDIFNNSMKLMTFYAGLPPEVSNPALPPATGEFGEEIETEMVDE